MTAVFKNPMGIVALLIGVIVAWLAGQVSPL